MKRWLLLLVFACGEPTMEEPIAAIPPETCGNGVCGMGENPLACLVDCPDSCGNGLCGPEEDAFLCEVDCPITCGDSLCSPTENPGSCPLDCPDSCGNDWCGVLESPRNCGADCGPPAIQVGVRLEENVRVENLAIDEFVRSEMRRQGLIGVGVAIYRRGELLYRRGYGYEDREAEIPVLSYQTMFRWASISKTLTAVVALNNVGLLDPGESILLWMVPARRDRLIDLLDQAGRDKMDVLVADHRFGVETRAELEAVAAKAAAVKVAVFAGGASTLIGTPAIASEPDERKWEETPAIDQDKLGLVLPRVMLRLPYGKKSDPIDAFQFEEIVGDDHNAYLWGNGAYAATIAMASGEVQIDDLPAYVYGEGDEQALKPCAEVCLADSAIEAIKKRGLIPLASFKDRNSVRVA